jgi:MYXO-CTERM domain-containing protein
MWRRISLAASLAIVGGVMLAARSAAAYVQYQTVDGVGMAWAQNCVPIVVYPSGFTQISAAAVETAAAGAAAAWSAGDNICTYLDLEVALSTAPAPTVRNDGINAIVFRTTSWCQMTNGSCALNYDPAAVSVATVTAVTSTGQIVDADVELNAVDFNWADLVTEPQSTSDQDLQNDLTEAFGHLIGLDAPCFRSSPGGTRPLDNSGQPAVDCDQASAAVQAETMFPAWPPGDTQKRTLAPDDQAALCGIYPLAANPRSCQVGSGTCICTTGDASAPTDGPTHDDGPTGGDTRDASAKDTAGAEASGCACSSAGPPAPYRSLVLAGMALVTFGRRRARS